jgi:3-oxoacyl-[acyl-carrier protein] reductase
LRNRTGCAIALAEAGADIAVNYRVREEEAKETCFQVHPLGRRAIPVRADVSKASEVRGMIKKVEQELGTIEILVNNAGIAALSMASDSGRRMDEIMAVNLKAAFW